MYTIYICTLHLRLPHIAYIFLQPSHIRKHILSFTHIPTSQWHSFHYYFCTSCCLIGNHSCTSNQKELCKNLNKLENSSEASISQIEIGSSIFTQHFCTFLCNAYKYATTNSCHCWRHLTLLVLLHCAAFELALCRLACPLSLFLEVSMDTFVMSILHLYAPKMSTHIDTGVWQRLACKYVTLKYLCVHSCGLCL